MSNSVEIDASKGVEEGVERRVSDVFLGLFWRRAMSASISFPEFRELAETCIKTREMETLVESVDYKALYNDLIDSLLTPEELKGVPRPPEEPEEPEEVQIDQHTFVSEKDAQAEIEALKAEADKGSEAPKPGSWAKTVADRKFKQAVVERIREARKMGIGSEVIAQNSRGQGVTGDTVRQILKAQAVDVRKYRKIDEALDRLGVPKAQEETDERKEE